MFSLDYLTIIIFYRTFDAKVRKLSKLVLNSEEQLANYNSNLSIVKSNDFCVNRAI